MNANVRKTTSLAHPNTWIFSAGLPGGSDFNSIARCSCRHLIALCGLIAALSMPSCVLGDVVFSNNGYGVGNTSGYAFNPALRGSAMQVRFPVVSTNIWMIETLRFQVASALFNQNANVSGHIRVWDDWSPSATSAPAFRNKLLDINVPLVLGPGTGFALASVDLTTLGKEFSITDSLIAVDVELTVNGAAGTSLNGVLFRSALSLLTGQHLNNSYFDFGANGVLNGSEDVASLVPSWSADNRSLGTIIEGREIPDPSGFGLTQGFPSTIPEPGSFLAIVAGIPALAYLRNRRKQD